MFTCERPVDFQDVDAAGIVYFPRILSYSHDAMARFFDEIEGGYVGIINGRRVGFPAVHVTADFRAPLRYGDVARVEVTVPKVGTTSCSFRYALMRKHDRTLAATIEHVVVVTDLRTMTKVPVPEDIRALLVSHAR